MIGPPSGKLMLIDCDGARAVSLYYEVLEWGSGSAMPCGFRAIVVNEEVVLFSLTIATE